MQRICLIAAAVGLGMALAAPAGALPPEHSKVTCNCKCDAGNGVSHDASYDAIAMCGGYEGKTCNFQGSDGTVKTGSLKQCTQGNRWVTGAAAANTGQVAQPTPKPKPKTAAPAISTMQRSN
jgi:hypothetical protein